MNKVLFEAKKIKIYIYLGRGTKLHRFHV